MDQRSGAQRSGDHFAISVVAARGAPIVVVCLAGEIDLDARPALSGVVDLLSDFAPSEVLVDLADVSFACSTLPNFLARLHRTLPAGCALVVCRPGTSTRKLLQVTGMEQIVTLRAELPMSVSGVPHESAGQFASQRAAPG